MLPCFTHCYLIYCIDLTLDLLNLLNRLVQLPFWNCPLSSLGISERNVSQQYMFIITLVGLYSSMALYYQRIITLGLRRTKFNVTLCYFLLSVIYVISPARGTNLPPLLLFYDNRLAPELRIFWVFPANTGIQSFTDTALKIRATGCLICCEQ
jgi:hypothetical protein